ncbi:DUF5034 domain-containing protein [Pararhodonellum marinum]|uniref:DUF5034 domain-containing protein n=1 Tax=Pararhodonellum marinum TaxID=2755358 RepID=UPI00188E9CEB|nr:DUF5034 domain-containing protein [Pararhodonellum marinum]
MKVLKFKLKFWSNVFSQMLCLMLISACANEQCENVRFEIIRFGLTPRSISIPSGNGGNGIWRNEDMLNIDRLVMRIEMAKNPDRGSNLDGECTVWNKINPAVNIRLISNKDFNPAFPAGSDLTEIVNFTHFLQEYTKEDFIDNHLNRSNWNDFYFTFEVNPETEDLHTFILIADLEDGTTMESFPVEVLLIPSE